MLRVEGIHMPGSNGGGILSQSILRGEDMGSIENQLLLHALINYIETKILQYFQNNKYHDCPILGCNT